MATEELKLPLYDLTIVGGGAAGYFAAIACAEAFKPPLAQRARLLILEKASRPLGKVLASGGGRCNLTHACFDPAVLVQHYPRGGAALRGPFTRFQPEDTIAWFEQHGIAVKTEPDGRVFPASNMAQSVVDCLQETAARAGVELCIRRAVEGIVKSAQPQAPFLLRLRPGGQEAGQPALPEALESRFVLLASGGEGAGFRLAADLGHTVETPVPSLFSFSIPDPRLAGLEGLSVQSAVLRLATLGGAKLPGLEQSGAVLITHWGLSGPAVLRLSAWGARSLHDANYRGELSINWLGSRTTEEVLAFLRPFKGNPANARLKVFTHYPFHRVPQRLWKRLAQAAGIAEKHNWGDLSKNALMALAKELTQGAFTIQGKGPFKEEFVTCGGVQLDQVNFKTMESRLVPGLYFAGEVLDVDGLTGGFNLQNAWTTGWIAGTALAERLRAALAADN